MCGREVVLPSSFVGDPELIVFGPFPGFFLFLFGGAGGMNANWPWCRGFVSGLKIGMLLGSM